MSRFLSQVLLFIILSRSSFQFLLTTTASSTNDTDRLALLDFKRHITVDPLGALQSWNESAHYCEWSGVKCNRLHPNRVIVLDLESRRLEGTLSPNIGNLSFLRNLTLTDNNFYGPIPQELGRLFRLQTLLMNNNFFSGEIPTNLAHCFNLRYLDLVDNELRGGIPHELTTLTKLDVLRLSKNDLKGSIPSSLGNLSSLTVLALSESNLTGNIPNDICRIQTLKFFQMSVNNLSGTIPSCIYNLSHITDISVANNHLHGSLPLDIGITLPNLQGLNLGNNKFSGLIPASLSNASKLEQLSLYLNQFTGRVPKDLGRLQHLQTISLAGNQLGGDLNFISSLTNCSYLKKFDVSETSLKGSIPVVIANLSINMEIIGLQTNQLHGSIPGGIQNLVNLKALWFGYNNLSGVIPPFTGMLSKLRVLSLRSNSLSGEIPDSFGNLTQLLKLYLSENKLLGKIPSSLGSCKNLLNLHLSNNRLYGTIPTQLLGVSSLNLLDLSRNSLTGSLPSEVGSLVKLVWLSVSHNRLSGSIPNTLGKCSMLVELYLEANWFEGEIPQSLSPLKSIQRLDLSGNKLSGMIPQYLENFTDLIDLNLSYNELEGPIPMGGVFTNVSAVSIVGNNKLCGGVVGLKLLQCHMTPFKNRKSISLKILIPVILASLCFLGFMCFIFMCYQKKTPKKGHSSMLISSDKNMGISYTEILKATNNFSGDNLLGVGSYGFVYKGILDEVTTVAVKVFDLKKRGGSKSFLSECNALRNVRHRNLIKIINCCSSVDFLGNDFKALVFDFMPRGSLEDWLHPKADEHDGLRNLNFLQRLNIAIDVASALDYLHHHCLPAIVHCDLKPSNVLLDDDMTAHVADFGLAKVFSATSSNSSQSQESSLLIKGSIGYVAPEYGIQAGVSREGDVYSFGILLLEMFTGKRPTNDMFYDGRNLHSFAKATPPERMINIIDPRILFEANAEGISKANQNDKQASIHACMVSTIELGITCSAELPSERITMGEVLTKLYHIRDKQQGLQIHLK